MRGRHPAHGGERGPRGARGAVADERGQATVEYLVVLGAFLAMLLALGALWRAGSEGDLVQLAADSASHGLGQGTVPLLKDVLGY
ncbi:MAG TPA: hypothetical protein IAA19_06060 [Candidatus Olsenella pullistercoris]|uniref:Uncharacterized protein n=1 Tax=Candidatus Olsenella pullistercoris TaxID=2838712 RepID=A0A9D2JEF1_9ACTN|nr:hypothetical protein [Candidatus Olsenella pullistercoris]